MPILASASRISDEITEAAITRCIENPCKKTCLYDYKLKLIDYFLMSVSVLILIFSFILGGFMIKLNNVSYSYKKDKKFLNNINLEINAGECILILGESGCGKSTIIKMINGLIQHFYKRHM